MKDGYKVNFFIIYSVATADDSDLPIGILILIITVILNVILVVAALILLALWSEFNLLHTASHMCYVITLI